MLRLPEIRVRSSKFACARKASACPNIRPALESQLLRIGAFVSIFAVRSWMEPLGRTHSELRCIALRPDDLRGDVRTFRMLANRLASITEALEMGMRLPAIFR